MLSGVGALSISEVPRHLVVIGGGAIELGSVRRRLGSKVTVVELLPTIQPGMDDDVIKEAHRTFRRQGLQPRPGTKVVSGRREGDNMFVEIETDGSRETLPGDHVLVSIGHRPARTGIDAAAPGRALRI